MNGHPNGCQCDACLGRANPSPGVYAYAASWPPAKWWPAPTPSEPSPVIAMYMAQTPPEPSFPSATITWTQEPSPELVELRKIGATLEGMKKLVEQFLARGKRNRHNGGCGK